VINARREHSATFACKVSNYAGETSAKFELNILVPPRIDGPPLEEITFVEGQPLDLQCLTDGIPEPKLSWVKDKQNIVEVPDHIEVMNGKAD
jgi:hemicentin